MDERVRKRKSLWEAEDENQRISWSGKEHYATYDGGRSHRFSSSKADNNSMMLKDQAEWPSWESLEENIITQKGENIYKDGQDEPKMREQGENKNCYKSMSPGLDEWGRRKHSNSPDDSLSRSRRYLEGSTNRSRDRVRSRSRSSSWSRGRDRHGIRSRSRSKSRSRSRSWGRSRKRDRNSARGRTRSRSPFHERRRESHGWNDRRGSGISSQTCRDFAAGNCRRGSQCRFFHPDRMDGDCSENDLAERWRSRPENGHALGYGEGPGRESRDKVSDSNYGEDDSFRSKSRSTICCKDFMRGNCKWGASCRFSHHIGSGDNNDKVTRNATFDRDRGHQPSESRKTLCKYFLAGKCNRDNCWFSHDGPTTSSHESRPVDEGGSHGLAHKNGRWNGPTWDQAEPESKIEKATGWSESVANKNGADAIPVERRDNRWADGSRTWGNPDWKEKVSENNNYISTHEWKEDNGGNKGAIKSMITENSSDRQEYPHISQGLESQSFDVISKGSHAPKITQEASSQHLSETTIHSGVAMKSDNQRHPSVVENNVVNAFSFDGLGDLKDKINTTYPVFKPGQSLNENGVGSLGLIHPLVSNDQRDNLFFPHPSNVRNFDLNSPGQVLSSSLNLQNLTHSNQQEAAKTLEMQEIGAPQSFYNNASNSQVAQILFCPAAVSPAPKFVNEQAHAHPRTTLNPLTSTGVVSSLEITMQIQPIPTVRSPDQSDPLGDGRGNGANGNPTSGEFPYPFQQKNQIPFEEFSPMSGDNPEFGNALPSVCSKVQFHESPKSKQQETLVSEVQDKNTNSAEETEKGGQNIHKENGDGHVKVDNSNSNKDDKDMRLFKNALVEFVKEILKPMWKEGRMSREVHKTIVKKVVDKVTSTIHVDHIPKTQDKIDQYLSHSKTKLTKLVQAYVERHLKTDS